MNKKSLISLLFYFLSIPVLLSAEDSRSLLSKLVKKDGEQKQLLNDLVETGDTQIKELTNLYKRSKFLTTKDGEIIVQKEATNEYLITGKPFTGDISSLKKIRTDRKLRKAFSRVNDIVDLEATDLKFRKEAARKLGSSQNPKYVPELESRIEKQPTQALKDSFNEALQISLLKNGTPEQQLAAIHQLGEYNSVPASDFLSNFKDAEDLQSEHAKAMAAESKIALAKIKSYQNRLELIRSLFRGLSTGSILLIVSYGLAITFGLMGVINMAHGEFIAIGAYCVYVTQTIFTDTFAPGSPMHEYYFIFALPVAFLVTALLGALLERGVIQFLYKRPLESLLATWGISMLMKQAMKNIFGTKGVAVSSPEWLAGNLEVAGVSLTYNRISVIVFSGIVILMTWLLLNRSRLGLHIRATMQNRNMASGLGIASNKINILTFAYGSGLAGLAGAFISQINNVSPELGGQYIVDSFMVVVVGGVGNLMGAALSAMGIGITDQILQPYVGPVMGKILVLFTIILFLQWRPGGLFPSRSRSLDD